MPRRILQGTVVSDSMDKTIRVKVTRRVKHPVMKKFISLTKNIFAHDPDNASKVGEVVNVQECAPYSKNKTWELVSSTDSPSKTKSSDKKTSKDTATKDAS